MSGEELRRILDAILYPDRKEEGSDAPRPRSIAEVIEAHSIGVDEGRRARRIIDAARRYGRLYALVMARRDDPQSIIAAISYNTLLEKRLLSSTAVTVTAVATDDLELVDELEARGGERGDGDGGVAVVKMRGRPEAVLSVIISFYGDAVAVIKPEDAGPLGPR